MLTGLLRPTAGDCLVSGHSITKEAAAARRHLGYCPQQNVLFPQLSVWEHLLLYSAVKAIPGGAFGAETAAASEEIMIAVGLEDKKDTYSAALSGGMKRKLQVEPSSFSDVAP